MHRRSHTLILVLLAGLISGLLLPSFATAEDGPTTPTISVEQMLDLAAERAAEPTAERATEPTTGPTTERTTLPATAPEQIAACCKICRKGKACGDSCIRRDYTCRKGKGCACDG
jgi:hypothetical protein